jgi:hypothetical protein
MLFRCQYTNPGNMFVFNSYMSQLTQKDMYPSDEIFGLIFEFSEKDSPIEHFETLGYEGANFVSMTGSLLINIVITIGLSLLLKITDFICQMLARFKYARKCGASIKHSNTTGAILTLYLQGFLEMLICALVAIGELGKADFTTSASDTFAALFGLFSTIMLFFMFFFIIYILKFKDEEEGLMVQLHAFIYNGISMKNFGKSLFQCVFLLRRFFFVLFIYFLEPHLSV